MEILSPRQIKQTEAERFGITEGWYGIKVSGTLMIGAFPTREECEAEIKRREKEAKLLEKEARLLAARAAELALSPEDAGPSSV